MIIQYPKIWWKDITKWPHSFNDDQWKQYLTLTRLDKTCPPSSPNQWSGLEFTSFRWMNGTLTRGVAKFGFGPLWTHVYYPGTAGVRCLQTCVIAWMAKVTTTYHTLSLLETCTGTDRHGWQSRSLNNLNPLEECKQLQAGVSSH